MDLLDMNRDGMMVDEESGLLETGADVQASQSGQLEATSLSRAIDDFMRSPKASAANTKPFTQSSGAGG